MIARVHKGDRAILALCDSPLLGKRFEEGRSQLDLTSDFFRGEEMDEARAGELVEVVDIIFAVGKESVALLVSHGLAGQQDIKRVSGIPYLQVVRL